jgi:hypothetical protein
MNTKSLIERVKKKGLEEGFNEFEITLLARELLRAYMTRRQLNYWFPIRSNTRKRENAQNVQNIENKDKVQYPIASVSQTPSQKPQTFAHNREDTGAPIISSADPKKLLTEKIRERMPCGSDNRNDQSRDFFQISKNCDFITEHYIAQVTPSNAVDYLRRYVDKCKKIDFAFRVVEYGIEGGMGV